MRRQFNGGPKPSNYGSGFRSRFPADFDDPFGKRSYESSFYGGAFRDSEPRLHFKPYNSLDRGGPISDEYDRHAYPTNFVNRSWNRSSSNMNVESFLQMGSNNSVGLMNRRVYGKSAIQDLQIENTKNGNNFTAFDEEPESTPIINNPVPEWNCNTPQPEKYKAVEVKCKVCNITLTSKGVYEVHTRGKKHLKKEADSKKYSCELCCTQMFTMEDQKAHNETEQHQESVKVAEFFEKQRNEDPDIQKVKALAYKQPSMLTQTEINELKATTNELKYRCDLCNVNCNAPQMLTLHLNSKKHVKKANDLNLNSKAAAVQYSCDVCNFLCYSSEDHEKHSKSDEHIRAIAEKYKAGTIHTPAIPKDVIAAGISKTELDVVPERGTDNILWYTCTVCDVKTNSLENHKMHINSKKHKTKVAQPGAQTVNRKAKYSSEALRNSYTRFVSGGGLGKKITGDPGAYCARCEIQFKTPRELEEHFLTLAHKNHNPYKKKLFFDHEAAAKKAKLNNESSSTAGKTATVASSNQTIPLPTSDYGYGGYEFAHTQNTPNYSGSYGGSYQPNYGYQSSTQQNNYQSPGSYGYNTTTNGYYTNYNNSTDPASYCYSAPFYQH